MKVHNYRQIEGKKDIPGVLLRVLVGPNEGAPNFAMRLFEIQPGSSTPYHSHTWEHEVFIISGRGLAKGVELEKQVGEGDAVFVAPDEQHCFANTGDELLRLICVVPLVEGRMPGAPAKE